MSTDYLNSGFPLAFRVAIKFWGGLHVAKVLGRKPRVLYNPLLMMVCLIAFAVIIHFY